MIEQQEVPCTDHCAKKQISPDDELLVTENENLRNEIIKLVDAQEKKESKFKELFNEMKRIHYKEV